MNSEQQLALSWTHGSGQAQAEIWRERLVCSLRWQIGVVVWGAGVRSVCVWCVCVAEAVVRSVAVVEAGVVRPARQAAVEPARVRGQRGFCRHTPICHRWLHTKRSRSIPACACPAPWVQDRANCC